MENNENRTIEALLSQNGINYQVEIINCSIRLKTMINLEIIEYHDRFTIINENGYDSLPKNSQSYDYIEGVIKNAKQRYVVRTTNT